MIAPPTRTHAQFGDSGESQARFRCPVCCNTYLWSGSDEQIDGTYLGARRRW